MHRAAAVAAEAGDERYVEIVTREGTLRAPRRLLFTTWADAPKHCCETGGKDVVSCFQTFPSFPVEAALMARLSGENTLFWMLLRRLGAAHQSLHAKDSPAPAVDPSGYSARLREYGSLLVSVLFLLAACHRLQLTWNEGILVDKVCSQLSLRTLPLVFDATARFRHDSGESTQRLLAACHDMYAREAWRYDESTRTQLEAADRAFVERTAASTASTQRSSACRAASEGDGQQHNETTAAAVGAAAGAGVGLERVLEAQLRSVEREIEAQRKQGEAVFAAALERRLAEAEDTLALAHNKISALEAGLCASRELAISRVDTEPVEQPPPKEPHVVVPDAGPKVYAAAMAAAKEDLNRYLTQMRTALEAPRTIGELTQEAISVFELAAEREAGHRSRYEQQLQTLCAESKERAREAATVRQRLAQALEEVEQEQQVC